MDANKTLPNQENDSNVFLENILLPLLSMPMVKVNREEFLVKTFKKCPQNKLNLLISEGPVKSGIYSQKELKKIAESLSSKRKLQTTTASFVAGLPGGVAAAATIPADTLQFFAVSLRLAQELSYLYGRDDFWKDSQITDKAKTELLLYLGTMFGVGGAASTMRYIAKPMGEKIAKNIMQKSLNKTVWYPILKKLGSYIGVKVTKDSVSKSVAKVVPIVGGVIAGSMSYFTMGAMIDRLIVELDKSFEYTEDEIQSDLETIQKEFPDIYDAIYTNVTETE